jgi:ribonucleoside-diphosphate reductase alpha chain
MSTLTEQSTIRSVLERARTGHEDVIDDERLDELVESVERSLYDGVDADERDEGIVGELTARIERHPAYDDAAARVARRKHFRAVTGEDPPGDGWALSADEDGRVDDAADLDDEYAEAYREAFVEEIEQGVRADIVDERLLTYDLSEMAAAIRPERDERFDHIAVDTLAQRYFLDDDGDPLELPQAFWMRVAMGIALREPIDDRAERAREFYELLSTLRFVHSSPTLFHAGTTHPQLASCYVTTVPDDLEGIFDAYKSHAKLSKWSGGLGTDWTPVLLHLQSSMRMGDHPRNSVLDENCEARAVEGLFIADNSALPNSLGGPNPTLSTQALATRTAEKIFQQYFGGDVWVGSESPICSIDDVVTQAVINRGI